MEVSRYISDKYYIGYNNNICYGNDNIIYSYKNKLLNLCVSKNIKYFENSAGNTHIMILDKILKSITIYNIESGDETIINNISSQFLTNCKSYNQWFQIDETANSITDDGINFIKTDHITDYTNYIVFEKYIIFQYQTRIEIHKIESDYQLTLVYNCKYDIYNFYKIVYIFDNILVMTFMDRIKIIDLTDTCTFNHLIIELEQPTYIKSVNFNYLTNIIKVQKFFTSDAVLEIDASKYRNTSEQIKLNLPAIII
jgi:hypothetical protein